jgi:hypothetical protein
MKAFDLIVLRSCVGHTGEHLAGTTRPLALLDSGNFPRKECAGAGARPSSPEAGCLRRTSAARSTAAAEGPPSGQRPPLVASPSVRRSPSLAPDGPDSPRLTTSSNRFRLVHRALPRILLVRGSCTRKCDYLVHCYKFANCFDDQGYDVTLLGAESGPTEEVGLRGIATSRSR